MVNGNGKIKKTNKQKTNKKPQLFLYEVYALSKTSLCENRIWKQLFDINCHIATISTSCTVYYSHV